MSPPSTKVYATKLKDFNIFSCTLQCKELEGYVLLVTKETQEENEQSSVIPLFIQHNEKSADCLV